MEGGTEVSHHAMPEPMLIDGRPLDGQLDEPPADLPRDGKDFWRDTISSLIDAGMIDLVDYAGLKMLATQYARWQQASRVVAVDGHFTRGSVGQLREHPAVKIEREAHMLFFRTAEHFGLTPLARTRLGLAEVHRRSLQAEMGNALGDVDRTSVTDAEVVDDDIGLPGI